MPSETSEHLGLPNNELLAISNPPSLLSGEIVQCFIKVAEGHLILTNYRLILLFERKNYFISLGVIERTEIFKVFFLHILCKDACSYKCNFSSGEDCLDWQNKISDIIKLPLPIDKVFASVYFQAVSQENLELHSYFINNPDNCVDSYTARSHKIFYDEIKRLGFDLTGSWRISTANDSYELCPSYPRRIVVPACISDQSLERVAKFRFSRRIPSIVWRHENGAVIARSSQPAVGLLCWRSDDDENLVRMIAEACAYNAPSSTRLLDYSDIEENNIHNSNSNGSGLTTGTSSNISERYLDSDLAPSCFASQKNGDALLEGENGNAEAESIQLDCNQSSDIPDGTSNIPKSISAFNLSQLDNEFNCILNQSPPKNSEFREFSQTPHMAETNGDNPAGKKDSIPLHTKERISIMDESVPDLSTMCDLPEAKLQKDIKKLLIMDARSYAAAVANRARGGGCECPEYYHPCDIEFMNLENIHTIRNSHYSLRSTVSCTTDSQRYLSSLEASRWLGHIGGLLRSAVRVAYLVAKEGRPVLVHCSDGWDRTPQITALAQILLDPFYRTLEGFQILVEREWLEYGHKFNDRCGSRDDSERCPVFLQWLDCVHQLLVQYPTAFQFNEAYLVKLCQHTYSNLFGTFLMDCSRDRVADENKFGGMRYYSLWPLFVLHYNKYTNFLYSPYNQVLDPSHHPKDLVLWKAVYMDRSGETDEDGPMTIHEEIDETNGKGMVSTLTNPKRQAQGADLVKTKSCDNLLKLTKSKLTSQIAPKRFPSPLHRTSSDPNFSESLTDMALLRSALGSELGESVSADDSVAFGHSLVPGTKPITGSTDTLVPARLEGEMSASQDVPASEQKASEIGGLRPQCKTCRCASAQWSQLGEVVSTAGDCVRRQEEARESQNGNGRHSPITPLEERNVASHDRSICSTFSDGLPNYTDDVTIRLNQIEIRHQLEVDSLRRELQATRALFHLYVRAHNNNGNSAPPVMGARGEDQMSLPESVGSGSGGVSGSDGDGSSSWEAIDECNGSGANNGTLWVPDHAVTSCSNCHSQFWIGRRRHHCRNCGKVFCSECSEHSLPLPKENLFNPVRVCGSCFSSLIEFRPRCVQVASN